MFCPKCGKEIPDHAKFCPKCGATVSNSNAAGSMPPPAKMAAGKKPSATQGELNPENQNPPPPDIPAAHAPDTSGGSVSEDQAARPRRKPSWARKAVLGVAVPVIWLYAWLMTPILFVDAFTRYFGGWTEILADFAVQLPVALATLLVMRRAGKPAHTPRVKLTGRATRKLVLLYALAAVVPAHMLRGSFASATQGVTESNNVWAYLLGAVFVAPALEELAFRGVLLGMSRRVMGFWPSVIVNIALFQVGHASLESLVVTVPIALSSAALRETTGRLRYGVYLHFANNALALANVFLSRVLNSLLVNIPVYAVGMAALIFACVKRDKFINWINR